MVSWPPSWVSWCTAFADQNFPHCAGELDVGHDVPSWMLENSFDDLSKEKNVELGPISLEMRALYRSGKDEEIDADWCRKRREPSIEHINQVNLANGTGNDEELQNISPP